MKVGYARVSTVGQDAELQTEQLKARGVSPDRIYTDKGWSGANRARPELEKALAAVRDGVGDEFIVTKLDRLARSVRDLHEILDQLVRREVTVVIGDMVYDPANPFSRLMVTMLGAIAEFERDLIRERTREGMEKAKAAGRLKGKQPKLKDAQEKHLVELFEAGKHTVGEIADLFEVSRKTVYRIVERRRAAIG